VKKLLYFYVFIIVISLFCACSSQDNVDDVRYDINQAKILNGELTPHSDFPSTAAIIYKDNNYSTCTGTFIKKNLVLTARHCMVYELDSISVAYGYDHFFPDDDIETMPILDKVYIPGYDMGILFIDVQDDDITYSDILPMEFFDQVLNPGDPLIITGYGRHEIDRLGRELYSAEIPIISRDEYEMVAGERQDEVDNPPNSCYGDSGAGNYVDFHGKRYVAGVTSRAPEGESACGFGAIYGLPGPHQSFIDNEYDRMLKDQKTCSKCEKCEECEECDECIEEEPQEPGNEGESCNIVKVHTSGSSMPYLLITFLLMFLFSRRRRI
jgi:hypothetical protein